MSDDLDNLPKSEVPPNLASIPPGQELPPPNFVHAPGLKPHQPPLQEPPPDPPGTYHPQEHPQAPKQSHHVDVLKFREDNNYRKEDPPLIDLKVTNPVTYLKKWWKRLMANEGVSLSLKIRPITAIALMTAFAMAFGGTGFGVAKVFFPNSSPILKREVLYEGTLKKSGRSFYINLANNETYRLEVPREINALDLVDLLNQQILVRGNLGKEPNLIKVKELSAF